MVDTAGTEDQQGPETTETEAADGATENTEAEAIAADAAPEAEAETAAESAEAAEDAAEAAADGADEADAGDADEGLVDEDEPEVEPTAFRLATRTEERIVDGRIEAAEAAKAWSKESGQSILVEREDGRVKMNFRDGALVDYVFETRKGRRA